MIKKEGGNLGESQRQTIGRNGLFRHLGECFCRIEYLGECKVVISEKNISFICLLYYRRPNLL